MKTHLYKRVQNVFPGIPVFSPAMNILTNTQSQSQTQSESQSHAHITGLFNMDDISGGFFTLEQDTEHSIEFDEEMEEMELSDEETETAEEQESESEQEQESLEPWIYDEEDEE
jgi:diadenosine tetraphosphate (Ap4A) HIT family hydrolase